MRGAAKWLTRGIGAVLLLAACGGAGTGVIVGRTADGVDRPRPPTTTTVTTADGSGAPAPSGTAAASGATTPTTAPATAGGTASGGTANAGTGTTPTSTPAPAPAPAGPRNDKITDEATLWANPSFLYALDAQDAVLVTGYRARYVGTFDGAPREFVVVVSGERFRVEFEGVTWVADGTTTGALRCEDNHCAATTDEPAVAAVAEPLQPLASPLILPSAVVHALSKGGSAELTYGARVETGSQLATCTVVDPPPEYVGFTYCVNPDGVVASLRQGEDYTVTLAQWTPGVAVGDFEAPFPVDR